MAELIERLLGRPFLSPDMGGEGGEGGGEGDGGALSGDAGTPSDDGADDDDAGGEGDGDDEGEGSGEDDDEEDFEYEDLKLRLPKAAAAKLRKGVMLEADYTRKRQADAEDRRQFEESRSAVMAADKELNVKRGQLAYVDAAIAKYEGVDWNALRIDHPDNYRIARDELSDLRATREKLQGEVAGAERTITETQRAQHAKRVNDTIATLNRDIPGWSSPDPTKPGIGAKVAEFAVRELGYTPQELFALADPRVGKALYRAWRDDQMAQKQEAARRKSAAPAPNAAPQPVRQVGSRGGTPAAKRSLNDLAKAGDMEAYAKARKAGRAA